MVSNLAILGISTGGAVLAIVSVLLFVNSGMVTGNESVTLKEENHVKEKETPELQDIYNHALDLVNKDRLDHGLSVLSLGDNMAAQHHADDLLKNKYFSHWNSEGLKPYVEYTKADGRGSVAENIASTELYCAKEENSCMPDSFDVLEEVAIHEYAMIHNDTHADNRHRDTILDPFNTHVNFGIAYDDERLYFVQHFERNLVDWDNFSLQDNDTLLLAGNITSSEFLLNEIFIYEDPASASLSTEQLNNDIPYNYGHYDMGDLVGVILSPPPSNKMYAECDDGALKITEIDGKACIHYEVYEENTNLQNNLDITVDVSKWLNQDRDNDYIHTIYITLMNKQDKDIITEATSVTLEYLN